MRADLTDENPPAQTLLDSLGGKAIPFLAIFCGNNPDQPRILEGVYTKTDLFRELDACGSGAKTALETASLP